MDQFWLYQSVKKEQPLEEIANNLGYDLSSEEEEEEEEEKKEK